MFTWTKFWSNTFWGLIMDWSITMQQVSHPHAVIQNSRDTKAPRCKYCGWGINSDWANSTVQRVLFCGCESSFFVFFQVHMVCHAGSMRLRPPASRRHPPGKKHHNLVSPKLGDPPWFDGNFMQFCWKTPQLSGTAMDIQRISSRVKQRLVKSVKSVKSQWDFRTVQFAAAFFETKRYPSVTHIAMENWWKLPLLQWVFPWD